ncbi:competence protein ComK [Falsibacillus albus]|uniref:Transcriptional regulator n=1 Tax=Falsibacillus albus TaxID=2478915 RepID=A0A3L7K2M0_9BACI|nr:competence protein ComK [Falsibacillus albus]RLQ97263.1 transcriptional regulator [Falsibacillus albus]
MELNKKMIEEYEINPFTMMMRPVQYGSKVYTEVYELNDQFLSPFKPLDIVKKSCEYFGSSFIGRKEGTKQLTGITRKPPIIVDPHTSIYLFPTTAPTRPQCIWISLEHIKDRKPLEDNSALVTFDNDQSFSLPISIYSFENQFLRTTSLKTRFQKRIGKMEMMAWERNPPSYSRLGASEKKQSYIIQLKDFEKAEKQEI